MNAGLLSDILYADDTLIFGQQARLVEEYAMAVEKAGALYGMKLHWGKTQALLVGDATELRKPDGTPFENNGSLQYLGATLACDGRPDSELSRKLGTARADFNQLRQLWSHSGTPLTDKLRYFDAYVLSKLQYGLATIWLNTAQRRRMDGFVARCLRRILHVPAAFISRVSNATIYERAGVGAFSQQILKHQLVLLRKVALSQNPHLRRDTFADSSLTPQIGRFVRRVGRPRQDWTSRLLQEGRERFGAEKFQSFLTDTDDGADARWRTELQRVFSRKAAKMA